MHRFDLRRMLQHSWFYAIICLQVMLIFSFRLSAWVAVRRNRTHAEKGKLSYVFVNQFTSFFVCLVSVSFRFDYCRNWSFNMTTCISELRLTNSFITSLTNSNKERKKSVLLGNFCANFFAFFRLWKIREHKNQVCSNLRTSSTPSHRSIWTLFTASAF